MARFRQRGILCGMRTGMLLCCGLLHAASAAAPATRSESLPAYLFEGPVRTAEQSALRYEAESLLENFASAHGGRMQSQDMRGFGAGWSGDRQLFWAARRPGASLVLTVPVLADARYGIDLWLTRAPDYGRLTFRVDGESMTATFDGYAAQVEPGQPLRIGIAALRTGRHSITIRVSGRNRASTGYYAGIDRLALVPLRLAP